MAVRATMYDPSATYVARRKVTIGGRDFNVGDPVPRDLAGDERTYLKWWGARMLMKPEAGARVAPQPAPTIVPKAMVPAGEDRADWVENYSKHVAEKQAEAAPIPHANGHSVPASERLMDAVAAQAVTKPAEPPAPAGNASEGYIEPGKKGWCTVVLGTRKEQVRGFAAASAKLDEMRAQAGLAPLPAEAAPAADAPAAADEHASEAPQADATAAEPPVLPIRPGDRFVDGETGEIHTVQAEAEVEQPDGETPSAPWQGGTDG